MSKKSVYSIVLVVVLMGLLGVFTSVHKVKAAPPTIYIRADGSIEPFTTLISSTDNITYSFTDNINASIVVQRSNIIIDGNGRTLNGSWSIVYGFNLTSVSNVTIKNVNILEFGYAMWLEGASQCVISNNNATDNEGGIWLVSSTENTVSCNNIAQSAEAVALDSSSGNNITGNNITDSDYGVYVRDNSAGNTISGNNIKASHTSGIYLIGSPNNVISGNNIRDSPQEHICLLYSSNNNSIFGNTLTNSTADVGIYAYACSLNSFFGNNITSNANSGIRLDSSGDSTISENNISENPHGIYLWYSSNINVSGNDITRNNANGIVLDNSNNNRIYHNNLINNTNQVYVIAESANFWDDGVEGNYWSNYTGIDSNHDGIGDSWHEISENNTDHYPLMGPFSSFNTSPGLYVDIISNSTIEDFEYFQFNSTIIIHVSNMTTDQTHGFCRIRIPHALMNETYYVTIDGVEPYDVNYTLYDDGENRWIYFSYQHSTLEIVIIPEFPSVIILPLFMFLALIAVALTKNRRKTTAKTT